MLARYIAVWKLHGVSSLESEKSSLEVAASNNPRIAATITTDPEPYFFHIDRSALSVQLFSGLFSQDKEESLQEQIATEIADARLQRSKQTRDGIFLIFKGEKEVSAPELKIRRNTDEFSICVGPIGDTQIAKAFDQFIKTTLAALRLSLGDNTDRRFEKLSTVVYLIDPESHKPIYPVNVQGHPPRVSFANPLTEEIITDAGKRVGKLIDDKAYR